MRRIALLFLLFPFALSAQEESCTILGVQELSQLYQDLLDAHAELQEQFALLRGVQETADNGDGTITFTFTDGTTFTTGDLTGPAGVGVDSVVDNGDGTITISLTDGSSTVTTLVIYGCTDSNFTEYSPEAMVDDGSCATLASSCSDVEMNGYTYDVVEIGDQCWFAENLRTAIYANGVAIPTGLSDGEWSSTTSGATADYAGGRLYNWYAVDDARGLCPSGWHVATDGEWTELEDYITSQGFAGTEGTALKSTTGWINNGNGTDNFGFSARPGGYRDPNGNFNLAGNLGYWWSSSPDGGDAWYRYLFNGYPDIVRLSYSPRFGFSVRCLRDAE